MNYSVNINQKFLMFNNKKYVKYSYVARNRYHSINYVDRNLYKTLDHDILVWIDYDHQNEYMVIPAWYLFDFGTIPSWARWISEKDEYVAYLAHDRFTDKDCKVTIIDSNNLSPKFNKLKKNGKIQNPNATTTEFLYNRKFADKFMLQLIKEENEDIYRTPKKLQPTVVYWAVRFGWGRNFRKRNRVT